MSLQVGIVGLGFMAVTHIRAYRSIPEVQVRALCNPSGRHLDGRFDDVAGNVGSKDPIALDMTKVDAHRDFAEMLRNPALQLIDVCTPTHTHPDLVIAALEAGKHVLCEKPLARNTREAQRICAAARAAKTCLMPAMCMRFWPGWACLKIWLEEGTYGRILAARFRRVAEPPGWGHSHFADGAKSGGALLDLHIHDADFVRYLFGTPESVCAAGYSRFSGAIDHVSAQYFYPSGPMVHAEGAWTMAPGFGFNMSYTVVFEDATLDYDLARGADALRRFRQGQPPETVPLEGPDGYTLQARHLVQSILENTAPSVVTSLDGLRAIELCEAEERSIAERQPVHLA